MKPVNVVREQVVVLMGVVLKVMVKGEMDLNVTVTLVGLENVAIH